MMSNGYLPALRAVRFIRIEETTGLFFGSRVALNPGLGGVRDVASAIISHEQTQSKPSLLFSNFGCGYFQRICFCLKDYLNGVYEYDGYILAHNLQV